MTKRGLISHSARIDGCQGTEDTDGRWRAADASDAAMGGNLRAPFLEARYGRPRAGLLLALALIAAGSAGGIGAAESDRRPLPDFDVRDAGVAGPPPSPGQLEALSTLPGARVRWDERLGVPALIVHDGGYLTGPAADARSFLRSLAPIMRLSAAEARDLVLTYEYTTRHNGARHFEFTQHHEGLPVYGSLIKMTLDREGRVVIVGGTYFPSLTVEGAPLLGAAQAVESAAASIGAMPARPLVAAPDESAHARALVAVPGERTAARRRASTLRSSAPEPARFVFENSVAARLRDPAPITAEQVVFPMEPGRPARLGWKVALESDSGWYEMVIDARSGELLFRTTYAAHAPEGTVFTVQNPTLGSPQVVSFAGAPFDNAGWVADRATAGNNANAYTDLDNDESPDYQTQTPAAPDPNYQHFNFPFTDAYVTSGGTDVMTDRDAAITQAFFRINWLHDYFYTLGFDEPARNFQEDNFGRGGAGGDSMLVEVHNDFNSNPNPETSNTQSPPDGQNARMELNTGIVDSAFDADLVTHEFTHGVGNRIIANQQLPFGNQTWALGEGWSDFFGTSVWDDPIAGEYVCGGSGCPLYAYDNSPLVYSDLCTLHSNPCEPHRDGEIFTAALWDIRRLLISRYGSGTGKAETERLVVDGMKNTIPAATFLDARDGLLAADVATNGGANQCAIWASFAGREMGVSASTVPTQSASMPDTVTPATDVPSGCVPTADMGGPYTTPEGANVSLSAAGSSPGSDPSTSTIVLYEWDLDGDGQHDDATGSSATFTRVGQDGVFTIGLRGTNVAGLTDTVSTTVTVTNVVPSLALDPIAPVLEGDGITLSGSAADPGWLDPLSATVDWDDGAGAQALPGVLENARPDATLTFSREHVYGDDATFSVNVCASDDDATTCGAVNAVVGNADPTATIDPSGQTTYDGVSAYITNAGGTITVEARSTDPGSDDLTLTWDWDDGADTVFLSLVNPPNPDPPKSPSIQPRDETRSESHTYGSACLYDFEFRSGDDDGGSASDQAAILIVGNATRMRSAGWWLGQYRLQRPNHFTPQALECYLDIVVFISTVFDVPLDRLDAVDILHVNKNLGTPEELFDQQLLAAWLNFADGAIGLGDPVDTDGDKVNDSTFGDALLAAENVRNNPASTREELLEQKDVLERINTVDG